MIKNFDKYRISKFVNAEQYSKLFGFTHNKFMHNIDTFYYSVFVEEKFSDDSKDKPVLAVRNYFNRFYTKMNYNDVVPCNLDSDLLRKLQIVRLSIAMYEYHLSFPDMFDIFIARTVPNDSTPQIHVQIRSAMLWMKGVKASYEESMLYVKEVLRCFGLHLTLVQENRCDYCWHTNYFENPYRFLNIDNIAKTVVSRVTVLNQHAKLKGDIDYEIDYTSLGNVRSHKVFFRVYLKCKEVIEMQKKGFFFEVWHQQGLISAYDKEVFEICYGRSHCRWEYLYKAMLQFYVNHSYCPDNDEEEEYIRMKCMAILDDVYKPDYDTLKAFALSLCPPVTLVMNVEFATWRKWSASFDILMLPQNIQYGCEARIYDYLDARKAIVDYLTFESVRFVKGTDSNKARRPLHPFWAALRAVNVKDKENPADMQELVRVYSKNINLEVQKNRMEHAVTTYSVYNKGQNNDSVVQDWIDAIGSLNDNDFYRMAKYKAKKLQQLGEAAAGGVVRPIRALCLVDPDTSELINSNSTFDYNTEDWINQDGIEDD